MYIPQKSREYLVIYTGKSEAEGICICEQTILAEEDTAGPWYKPVGVSDFLGNEGSFANYRWTSDEVYENLYEPLRAKYPDYIQREHIGKDASDTYDMYCYIFAPEDYEQTVFLSGGMHANEEEGYFALAYFMGEVANAQKSNAQLSYLRERVRFIVVPMINVFGVSQTHDLTKANWAIRYNSTKTDLNRDFEAQTQQETKNVLAFFRQFADTIDFAVDFHNSGMENCSLWYNFINNAVNSQVNYKVTNHMYHRLMELGLCEKVPNIAKIPGGYYKASKYLEGRIWNEFDVPTITVEHVINSTFPQRFSEQCLTLGVETYGNFIIQNALFYIQK
jgi:hypothetical protein